MAQGRCNPLRRRGLRGGTSAPTAGANLFEVVIIASNVPGENAEERSPRGGGDRGARGHKGGVAGAASAKEARRSMPRAVAASMARYATPDERASCKVVADSRIGRRAGAQVETAASPQWEQTRAARSEGRWLAHHETRRRRGSVRHTASATSRTGARTGARGAEVVIPAAKRQLSEPTAPPHTREVTGSIPVLPMGEQPLFPSGALVGRRLRTAGTAPAR